MAGTFIALTTSCKKEPLDVDPGSDKPEVPTAFPIGQPTGGETTFTVTSAGGDYDLPDNSLKLTIPAGAVSTPTKITIQPVEATAPAGLGQSFRLLPHDIQFKKPITVQLSYADVATKMGSTQALGLAYQDEKGFWKFAANPVVNKNRKTVSVTTTHFSDWTLAHWFSLKPRYENTPEGGTVYLQVVDYFISSEDGSKDPFETLPKDMYMRDAKPLDPRYVKNGGKGASWQVGGPGEIVGSGSAATYTAPDFVKEPTDVSVAVVLIDPTGSFTGEYMLFSTITVTPKSGLSYRINKGVWTFIPGAVVGQGIPGYFGVSAIRKDSSDNYIHESLTILWRGGVGKYTWNAYTDPAPKYPNTLQHLSSFSAKGAPKFVISSWYVNEDKHAINSGGSIEIEEMENVGGYVKGTFTATNAGLLDTGSGKEVDRFTIDGYFVAKRLQ
ncbi:hypothetical protein GCM10028807_51460 [Spirosoma daeguense]